MLLPLNVCSIYYPSNSSTVTRIIQYLNTFCELNSLKYLVWLFPEVYNCLFRIIFRYHSQYMHLSLAAISDGDDREFGAEFCRQQQREPTATSRPVWYSTTRRSRRRQPSLHLHTLEVCSMPPALVTSLLS